MSASDIPDLQRPAFFDGQRLASADLEAVQDYARELRWLHNRSLHDWGIVLGLGVGGEPGERGVSVQPGYALDSAGRELILSEAASLDLPAVQRGPDAEHRFYLTISYQEDAGLAASVSRTGVCAEGGAVRRPERARLRWQSVSDTDPQSRYQPGEDIVLAWVRIENCRIGKIERTQRREISPALQPYLVAGATPEGATDWSFWPNDNSWMGVQTSVDTSRAGFTSTPVYTAQLIGSRVGAQNAPIDGFSEIVSPTPTGFVLRVLMPRNLPLGGPLGGPILNPDGLVSLPALRNDLRWYVTWIGVEG